MATSGDLIAREYTDFRGVDFSNKDVSLVRSPDSLNMWKDYKNDLGKTIETRPSIELVETYDNTIFGHFFYRVGYTDMQIVHCGTKLYKVIDGERTELFSGMNPAKSYIFVFNNILYIKDGLNYLQYDGETIKEVTGYIPKTSIGRKPVGGGTNFQKVNMLSDYRINEFCSDGESTVYELDVENFDNDFIPEVTLRTIDENNKPVDKVLTPNFDYTWNDLEGTITFEEAPEVPYTDGQDNISVKFKKHVNGYADRVKKSTLMQVFNNTLFISGNQDYPNVVWFSEYEQPNYIGDTSFYNEGLDLSPVKTMIAGNNSLWVLKEPSQANTTVFYHNPIVTVDPVSNISKFEYPSSHSNIATGCVATGINFNDDIVFFSDRGMEGISGDIMSEQLIAHRSSMVDGKLLNETNYKNMLLQEYEGYLMVFIDDKVYLADSRAMFTNEIHNEYEWFYWNLPIKVTCTQVKDGVLYLGTENGIYTLVSNEGKEIESYWTTSEDDFNAPQYQKTTNKRGCTINMVGESVKVSTKINNGDFEEIGTYTNTKGYVVSRIKKKKWKTIQLKLSSNKPFGLFSCTLESFVGGYVKR